MRLLLALGILGGATWIAYAFVPAECSPPSAETEIFCNRLWTPALTAMSVGFLGLRRWASALGRRGVQGALSLAVTGAAVMAAGNALEYWVFFSWPHQGPDAWLRGGLWIGVLIGWLSLLVGSIGAGITLLLGRRAAGRTLAMGAILVIVPSFTVFVGPLAVGALAIVACAAALVVRPEAPREAIPETP